MNLPKISIVVPTYGHSLRLVELTQRVADMCRASAYTYEIVFVDDGGPGERWSTLKSLCEGDPSHITALQLGRNYGQHNALLCGFARTRGEVVITLDDDLQQPPEEIPKLVRAIEGGAEVVFGIPKDKKHPGLRNLGSAFVQVTFQRTFSTAARPTAFRGIARRVVDEVVNFDKSHIYLDGLFAWVTNSIVEVEVEHLPRERGESGYSVRKLLALTLNFVTNSSLKPLQYSSVMGLVLSLIALSLAAYLVVRYFVVGIPVAGYASLFVLISLLGGIQLLSLGIIGEYIGRILMNSNGKPAFSVRQEILCSGDASGRENLPN